MVRPRGEASAITAILTGWLESGLLAWFAFIVGLGGGHSLRLLELLRLLFLCNSTVLIRLGVQHEFGDMLNEGITRI